MSKTLFAEPLPQDPLTSIGAGTTLTLKEGQHINLPPNIKVLWQDGERKSYETVDLGRTFCIIDTVSSSSDKVIASGTALEIDDVVDETEPPLADSRKIMIRLKVLLSNRDVVLHG